MIDRTDKAILRVMLRARCDKRPISTIKIANKAQINWKTAYAHLKNLEELYYVQSETTGKTRRYIRDDKKIEAKRTILWRLNVK